MLQHRLGFSDRRVQQTLTSRETEARARGQGLRRRVDDQEHPRSDTCAATGKWYSAASSVARRMNEIFNKQSSLFSADDTHARSSTSFSSLTSKSRTSHAALADSGRGRCGPWPPSPCLSSKILVACARGVHRHPRRCKMRHRNPRGRQK